MTADRQMHRPKNAPSCRTDGIPRATALWSYDQGRSCGIAAPNEARGLSAEENFAIALDHTPGCCGCTRAMRMLAIADKRIAPMELVKAGKETAA
jgi:hypothetical protein